MQNISAVKKNYQQIKLRKLAIASLLIGFLSALLAISLKKMTETYEEIFYNQALLNKIYFIIFPAIGLLVIYILRQYLFNKKQNKGIREIFECTASPKKNLPLYKIPSHFFNGFLTVIFGGSTGIEVSTVLASATIGSIAQQKENLFRKYKTELICAGVAAGITALFSSPFAGILFAFEVISRRVTRIFILTNVIAVTVAYALISVAGEAPLFAITIADWHLKALPYFAILGILAGLNSVYLTRCVLFFKDWFSRLKTHFHRIALGAGILSLALMFFPQLYGDGYHAIRSVIANSNAALTITMALTFVSLLILKPIVTSITLASGGDGGVFAPSLFIGAFLGLLTAMLANLYFDAGVIPLNFMFVGMAAMLSATIHAPFTALFIVCGVMGDYTLFCPILLGCLISKYTSKYIYPYTVYSFIRNSSK